MSVHENCGAANSRDTRRFRTSVHSTTQSIYDYTGHPYDVLTDFPSLNRGMAGIPYFTIIYIVLSIVAIYYVFMGILSVVTARCSSYTPMFREGFTTPDADEDTLTKSYYASLKKRALAVNKRVDAASALCETIRSRESDLDSDMCDVMRQIDDGVLQNYASNVPEGEYDMPADVQKERAAARKKRAEVYVQNQHVKFSEANEKTPLLECFSDATDAILLDLMDTVDSTDENLTEVEKSLKSLRSILSGKKLDKYFVTLKYNDKYIKDFVKTMNATREGFVDAPPPPGEQVNKLEERIAAVEAGIAELNSTTQRLIDTTKLQSKQLKQTKAVATKKF